MFILFQVTKMCFFMVLLLVSASDLVNYNNTEWK